MLSPYTMNCHQDGSLDCGGSYGLGKKVCVYITVQTVYVLGYGEAEGKNEDCISEMFQRW